MRLNSLTRKFTVVSAVLLLLLAFFGIYLYNFVMHLEEHLGLDVSWFSRVAIGFGALFLSAAVVVGIYIRRSVVRPLLLLRASVKKIDSGDYSGVVEVVSDDEVGRLSESFNRMREGLKGAVDEMQRRADTVMALNAASRDIVGITEPDRLYQAVCDHLLRIFGLRFVWLGLAEDDFSVRPVAHAGHEAGYLSGFRFTWDDSANGRGPTGMAIKTRAAQAMQRIDGHDSAYAPWAGAARERGYRSSLAVPLVSMRNRVIAAINLYSSGEGFFTDEVIELCQSFANHAATMIEHARLLAALEEQVSSRTRELDDARLLAENANKAKSFFLANMSHDLRTPLNAIIGFSDALASGVYGDLAPKHREYVNDIFHAGQRLLGMVDEILDLSRIETGSLQLEYTECSVRDIIHAAVYPFREKAAKHHISLDVRMDDGDETAELDHGKVKQAVVSLLSFALSRVADGGCIVISVHPAPDGDPHRRDLFITVDDDAPELTPGQEQELFDPFRRQAGQTGAQPGLALARRFVELHSGSVTYSRLQRTEGLPCSAHNRIAVCLPRRPNRDNLKSDRTEPK